MDSATFVISAVSTALGFVGGGGIARVTLRGRLRSVISSELALQEKWADNSTKKKISDLIERHGNQLISEESRKAFWQRFILVTLSPLIIIAGWSLAFKRPRDANSLVALIYYPVADILFLVGPVALLVTFIFAQVRLRKAGVVPPTPSPDTPPDRDTGAV